MQQTGAWYFGGRIHGCPLHDPQTHEQQRLSPIESLDLGYLVNAEHDGVARLIEVEVEADDVEDLFDK